MHSLTSFTGLDSKAWLGHATLLVYLPLRALAVPPHCTQSSRVPERRQHQYRRRLKSKAGCSAEKKQGIRIALAGRSWNGGWRQRQHVPRTQRAGQHQQLRQSMHGGAQAHTLRRQQQELAARLQPLGEQPQAPAPHAHSDDTACSATSAATRRCYQYEDPHAMQQWLESMTLHGMHLTEEEAQRHACKRQCCQHVPPGVITAVRYGSQ